MEICETTEPTRRDTITLARLYINLHHSLATTCLPSSADDDIEEAIQYSMHQFCLSVLSHVKISPTQFHSWLENPATRASSWK